MDIVGQEAGCLGVVATKRGLPLHLEEDDHHQDHCLQDQNIDNHHVSLHRQALRPGLAKARLVSSDLLRNSNENPVRLSLHRGHCVQVAEPVESDLARGVDVVEQGRAGVQLSSCPGFHHLEHWFN